jgi:Helicase associated domain
LDPVLNRWVSRQRRNKKDGILTEERIQKLESIGFRWVLVEQKRKDYSKKDLHWIQQYNSLASFQKQYGHTNPPHGKQSPYWQLAKWVARQRELFSQKRLLDERKELLDSLGFCWSMDDKAWHENFSRLVSHVQTYQHLDFQNDSSLGRWFYSQRIRFANGQMTQHRSRLLKSLGIEFEGNKAILKTGNEPSKEDESDDVANNDKKKSAKRKVDRIATSNPQELLFTVDFPMKPPKGTKIRKKRFMDGWCTGEVIEVDQRDVDDNSIKAKVRYEDGIEEYMSEEECRISASKWRSNSICG